MNMLHMPQEVARDLLSYCIDDTDHESWSVSDISIDNMNEVKFSVPIINYCLFHNPITVDIIVDIKNEQIILQVYVENKIISVLKLQDDCYQYYYNQLMVISNRCIDYNKNKDFIQFSSLRQDEQEAILHFLYQLNSNNEWSTNTKGQFYTVVKNITITIFSENEVELLIKDNTQKTKIRVSNSELPEWHSTLLSKLYKISNGIIVIESTTQLASIINNC